MGPVGGSPCWGDIRVKARTNIEVRSFVLNELAKKGRRRAGEKRRANL